MSQPPDTASERGELPSDTPPVPHPAGGLLAELASLVRTIAASADRDVAEAVAWINAHGL